MNMNIYMIITWIIVGIWKIIEPTGMIFYLWIAIATICGMVLVINKDEKAFETLAINRYEKRVKILKEEIE